MAYYTIRIQRYDKHKICRTRHRVEFAENARSFAEGYRAALHDVGLDSFNVYVYDDKGVQYYKAGE